MSLSFTDPLSHRVVKSFASSPALGALTRLLPNWSRHIHSELNADLVALFKMSRLYSQSQKRTVSRRKCLDHD